MAKQYRVLVVDDSTFMRGALTRMIERDARFKVVDSAVNGEQGVAKALELKPDVITMDIEMPVMNGIEALRKIVASGEDIPVVMVSTLTEAGADITMQALEIGAVDFIPKSLNDKDKNIFRGAEVVHEKLLAAVGAVSVSPQITKESVADTTARAMPKPVQASGVKRRDDIRVVVIGSSTGGPKALQTVLAGLPANLPVPVVVAQHMPANFTLALARRLDETVPMKVVEAKSGQVLEKGTVYIAPGGLHMRLNPTGLSVDEERGESPYKPSVDVLGHSAYGVFRDRILGVMLTGMGNDGTAAFVEMHKSGAHVIAQDQESSVVYGMPRAVLEAGGVDDVLPLDKIATRIRQLVG